MYQWMLRCRLLATVFFLCGFMAMPAISYGNNFINTSLSQGLGSDSLSHGQNLINLSPLYLLVAAADTSLDMAKVLLFKKRHTPTTDKPEFTFADNEDANNGQLEYIACDHCLKNTG